jgi:hypothetical protein
MFEGRTLPVGTDRRFSDSFAVESAYHIYKISL